MFAKYESKTQLTNNQFITKVQRTIEGRTKENTNMNKIRLKILFQYVLLQFILFTHA
jgi:hypothetical protein